MDLKSNILYNCNNQLGYLKKPTKKSNSKQNPSVGSWSKQNSVYSKISEPAYAFITKSQVISTKSIPTIQVQADSPDVVRW